MPKYIVNFNDNLCAKNLELLKKYKKTKEKIQDKAQEQGRQSQLFSLDVINNNFMRKVYIAGPLFSLSERIFLERIDFLCKELGFTTYLPHKDGGLFIRDDNNSNSFFLADRNNIDNSEIIIAILNGIDIDSGTSWEIGYGYSKNITILGYLEDIRIFNHKRQLNPMILNSLNYLANNIESLEEILKTLNDKK